MNDALFEGVELLSLDAGNTVIFLDHDRLAAIARELGHRVDAADLIVHEGEAKRLLSKGPSAMLDVSWKHHAAPGARGWGHVMGTIFLRAGLPAPEIPALLERLWESHCALNLYSKVPADFRPAIDRLRASGVRTAIVSNSEGMLEQLFRKLGILDCFDAVIDSGLVGVEKPDPRIFQIACARTGTTPAAALHLGDTMATDIDGALAAGMRAALIDPFGHYEGLYLDVPRVRSVASAVGSILAARRVC